MGARVAVIASAFLVAATATQGCGTSEPSKSSDAGAEATTNVRPTYELTPPGVATTDGPHWLALYEGTLVGSLVGGRVRTWLKPDRGRRMLVAWPGTYRARLDPLELLDDNGRVVAKGGEFVSVGGGTPGEPDPDTRVGWRWKRLFIASKIAHRGRPGVP